MLLLALTLATVALPQSSISAKIEATLESERADLIAFRRDLHRYPDVSGEEERTAAAVAEQLRQLGLEVRTGVGGHGIVATLDGAGPGPVLGFRADMDAVYSSAPDPVPFRSEDPGKRHICGHDVHTTVGVALAQALHAVRDAWKGTVVFYFQPEEETARGARAMIADGALDPVHTATPREFFAFHSSPIAVGSIGVTPGQALPARDPIRVVLSGKGDVRAAADELAETLRGLTTLDDPQNAPAQTEDFVVAYVSAPRREGESWVVQGQATVSSDGIRKIVRATIEAKLGEFRSRGVAAELRYDAALIPGVFNDPELLAEIEDTVRTVVGAERYIISNRTPPQFSEDFGAFQERAPGIMFWLGVSNPEAGTRGLPHAPDFVADEESIFVGARVMAAVLLERLSSR